MLTGLPAIVVVVYAVDDGSTDGTRQEIHDLAERGGAPAIEPVIHEENRGAGATVVTGYRHARRGGHDLVVTVDADDQMDLSRLPDLLDPLIDGAATYAKGDRLSCSSHREEMPPHRFVGNLLLTALTRLA